MMLRRKKPRHDERLDQVRREMLLSLKVSDEEIESAASAPDLYDGLQSRIAAQQGRPSAERTFADRAGLNFIPALLGPRRSQRWTLTAAAVLLLVSVALLLWLPKQSRESTQIAQPVSPQFAPSRAPDAESNGLTGRREVAVVVAGPPAQHRQRRTSHRRQQSDSRNDEIATDFLPLTFTADSTAPESGHLVRVTIPRSALVAMGLPMNAERAGELVRADVFIGDDGLARAIRFIQ